MLPNDKRHKVKLIIFECVIDKCIQKSKEIISSKSNFQELGGLLLGVFDGINIYATDYLYDDNAITTGSSIHFSQNIFSCARKIIHREKSFDNLSIIGTWHVHPPGYGTYYSSIDSNHLFQEQWLLKADVIDAVTHKAHLIIDGGLHSSKRFSAFHMKVLSTFMIKEVRKINLENFIPKLTLFLTSKFADKTAFLVKKNNNNYDLIDFLPTNFSNNNIIGFWQHYPFKNVCEDFENIYLEHYYNKLEHENFLYLRTFGSKQSIDKIKLFNIKRIEPNNKLKKIFNFNKIDYSIQSERIFKMTTLKENKEKIFEKRNKLSNLSSLGRDNKELCSIIQKENSEYLGNILREKFISYPFIENVIADLPEGNANFTFQFYSYNNINEDKLIYNGIDSFVDEEIDKIYWEILEYPIVEISVQNPSNPEQSLNKILFEKDKQISDLAYFIKEKMQLNFIPIFYSYFTPESKSKAENEIQFDKDKAFLPDNYTIEKILDFIYEKMPIYFETLEMNDKCLYKLRTDRFQKVGYDVNELNKKHILLGGTGILGNEIAFNLAVLGIGTISVVDYGNVDWCNIYRQLLFQKDDVYQKKVDVVKSRLEKLGKIRINAIQEEVPCLSTELNENSIKDKLYYFSELVKNSDLVVGAFDIFSARAVFQMLCLIHEKTFVSSALDANIGEVRIFEPNGKPCYCCGSTEKTLDGGACTLSRVEGQKIVGGITTKFIVDRLLNIPIIKNRYEFNSNTLLSKYVQRNGTSKCKVCGENGLLSYKDNYISFIYNWLYN